MKRWYWFGGAFFIALLADQVSKQMVVQGIAKYDRVPVIPGFFDLVHYRNTGIAFGMFRDGNPALVIPLFVTIGLAALFFLSWYLRQEKDPPAYLALALGLIGSGAVGNAVDRIRFGNVVDFLLVYVQTHHWPAFNVADSAITVGAILLGIDILRRPSGSHTEDGKGNAPLTSAKNV